MALGREPGDVAGVADDDRCADRTDPDNVGEGGLVTPRFCYRGFGALSFGQKKRPSPFATAGVVASLVPFGDLAEEALQVDIPALTSSKGLSGRPRLPRRQ